MKIGITLPQFRNEADTALEAARRAEDLGFDGVFCFDHLWPMGRPDRPALSSAPLLGALAAATSSTASNTTTTNTGTPTTTKVNTYFIFIIFYFFFSKNRVYIINMSYVIFV